MYGASKNPPPQFAKKVKSSSNTECEVLRSLDDCETFLKEAGLADEWFCLVADDYQLQLDIDSPNVPDTFYSMYEWISKHVPMGQYKITDSRSGNKHIIIPLLKPLPVYERIILQAILGSDLKREFFDYMNAKNGDKTPILLFEKK